MYLGIDNETGGIDDKTSLLSSYLAVVNSNLEIVDDLNLFLKPHDGVYLVEAGGLHVNKINLFEHEAIAETQSTAGQKVFKMIKQWSNVGADKLIPLGHTVTFDIISLNKQLLNRATWEQFVSYRKLDTSITAQFLKLCGKLPMDLSGSLESLATYFNIQNPAQHTGKGDVETTIAVLKAMRGLIAS